MVRLNALISRVFVFILIAAFIAGCSFSGGKKSPADSPPQADEPAEVVPVADAPAEPAAPADAAPVAPEAAPADPAPADPAPAMDTGIQHNMMPGEPVFLENQIVPECDSGAVYKPGSKFALRPGCDRWGNNMIERPFEPGTDTFYPWLDITTAWMGFAKDGWIYFEFELFENPTEENQGTLAVEVDADRDGRGDYLVTIPQPAAVPVDWTTDGVQVWQDANKNIGGKNAAKSDIGSAGDGFETLLFENAAGNDPDLAWVRKQAGFSPVYQVALKDTVLGGNVGFAWSIWAFGGELDPKTFDLVDSYQDGELTAVDNTCVSTMGMKKVSLPNQCSVTQPTPEKKKAGCVQPPHPNPQDNGWWFDWAQCKWILIN